MSPSGRRVLDVSRAIVRGARTERLTFMAGSIAYHAFVSLIPLVFLLVTVSEAVPGLHLESVVTSVMDAIVTEETSARFVEQLRQTGSSVGLSIVGVVVLLWGALKIVRGLDAAVSDIYGTDAVATLPGQLVDGVIVLGSMAVAIVSAVIIQRLVPLYGAGLPLGALHGLVLLAGLTLAMVPIYYVLPDADVGVREVVPGVFVAALGITAFTAAFRFYVEVSGQSSPALLANVLFLLTWLYFSSLIVVVGVVVNAVLSNRSPDVNIHPVVDGIEPGSGRPVADRAVLLESLQELDDRLADGSTDGRESGVSDLEIGVDGETIAVHPPHSVTVDRDAGIVPSDIVTMEMRWTPDENE